MSTVSPPDGALAQAHAVGASFVFRQSDAARQAKVLELVEAGNACPATNRARLHAPVGNAPLPRHEILRQGHRRRMPDPGCQRW